MSSKKKQKQISIEEYIETYCQEKRIRGRFAVYIGSEAYQGLKRITQLFSNKHYTTISSLTDSIITHHLKTYVEVLRKADAEKNKLFQPIKEKRANAGKESDSGLEDI